MKTFQKRNIYKLVKSNHSQSGNEYIPSPGNVSSVSFFLHFFCHNALNRKNPVNTTQKMKKGGSQLNHGRSEGERDMLIPQTHSQ